MLLSMLPWQFLCCLDPGSTLFFGFWVDAILVSAMTEPGYDPLWLAALLMVNLQLAVITSPVRLNLYAMKSAVPSLDLRDFFPGSDPVIFD